MATKKEESKQTEPAVEPAVESPDIVKARVLLRGPYGNVNDVVEVSADLAGRSPDLDPDPDAVAQAVALAREEKIRAQRILDDQG